MKKYIAQLSVIVVVSVCLIFNFIDVSFSGLSLKDHKSDVVSINHLNNYSISDIENRIESAVSDRELAEEEVKLANERLESKDKLMQQLADGKITYRQLFSDTLIVGDSLMNGLSLYRFLDEANMITMVSASLYHLDENMNAIISNSPEKLVLHYGINMLIDSEESLNAYISMYRRILNNLISEMPDTDIYVSSIFNVSDDVSGYGAIGYYNEALSQLCDELSVNYLDNSYVLPSDSDYFGSDGIHLSEQFYYEQWLPHLFYAVNK